MAVRRPALAPQALQGVHQPLCADRPAEDGGRNPHTEVGPARGLDYRDYVIEQFADDEALLRARVDIYRTIVIEAVAHIEELAQSLTRLRDRYHRLQDEYRELRHRTMRRTEAPS